MDAKAAHKVSTQPPFPRGALGPLGDETARKVVAAGGDVAMIIDRHGVICDMAVSNPAIARDGAGAWLDRRWSDTVTIDSKPKVDELIRDALSGAAGRWREVNQITPGQPSLMIRYMAVDAGRDGQVIAIGRDNRDTADMQKRLMEAQQAMERDYSRIRDAEFRYRLLFRTSSEAVLVVDAASRKIVEANPAAERLMAAAASLAGEAFVSLFDAASQDAALAMLTVAQSAPRAEAAEMRLKGGKGAVLASASLFRQDRASQCLVRLAPAGAAAGAGSGGGATLDTVMERIPDPFLVTDKALTILAANTAFLDLVRIGGVDPAGGQRLGDFLGRAEVDRNILLETLKSHGAVRNFSTVLRNPYGEETAVEVSAVAVPGALSGASSGNVSGSAAGLADGCYGFTLRPLGRRLAERTEETPDLRRSVAQLTELVGRVSLKELVRETTDLVERLCIEAALELTKDNRASAAEVLGLSRQSLYSKLHRFGLGNLAPGEQ